MSELDRLDEHTDRLLETIRQTDDLDAPSLCEGWTRSHVLAHLARNADGLARAAAGALSGSGTAMYDSQESRDADIEKGLGRSHDDVLADVASSAAALREVLGQVGAEQVGVGIPRLTGGEQYLTAEQLAPMRLREVVYHHVDLDAGFGFADLSDDLVTGLLEDQVKRLRSHPEVPSFDIRTDEGDDFSLGNGGHLVTGSRAGVLLWLARQKDIGVRSEDVGLPDLPKGV